MDMLLTVAILLILFLINMMVLTSLTTIRSEQAYNLALAKQGLGKKIRRMKEDPQFVASYEQYHKDIENNVQVENPVGAYYHLKMINKTIKRAKNKAWAG